MRIIESSLATAGHALKIQGGNGYANEALHRVQISSQSERCQLSSGQAPAGYLGREKNKERQFGKKRELLAASGRLVL